MRGDPGGRHYHGLGEQSPAGDEQRGHGGAIRGCCLAQLRAPEYVTVEPGKRGGKPCIRGLRVTVYDVLDYLAAGMTHAQILDEFPYLREEDIRACLAYAADRERCLMVAMG